MKVIAWVGQVRGFTVHRGQLNCMALVAGKLRVVTEGIQSLDQVPGELGAWGTSSCLGLAAGKLGVVTKVMLST